jgi:hypothetical protein
MARLISTLVLMMLSATYVSGCVGASPKLSPQSSTPGTIQDQPTQALSLDISEPDDESVVNTNPISLSGTISAGAEITVNGLSVNAENGNFTAMVELEEGPNSIEIRATDNKGHENMKVLTVIYVR